MRPAGEYDTWADAVADYLATEGISQRELGHRLDRQQPAISRWLAGAAVPMDLAGPVSTLFGWPAAQTLDLFMRSNGHTPRGSVRHRLDKLEQRVADLEQRDDRAE